MDLKDFEPQVLAVRGKYIGTLLVRKTAESYSILNEANKATHRKIHEATNTTSSKKSLPPRIDLCQVSDLASAKAAIGVLHNVIDIISEKRDRNGEITAFETSVPIVMEPTEEYWVRTG